jgi:NAD(P)-dependent dehydrogenase (short-subunit alcohol dehydrogenase family)
LSEPSEQRVEPSEQRVLIVGGSGGIGSAVAAACARRGAWPVVGYCHHPEAAQRVVHSLQRGETCRIDLTAASFEEGHIPEVDVVVHCGGCITARRRLLDSSQSEIEHLLAINALGPLRLTKTLLAQGDRLRQVLFMLSTAIACRGAGPYALSKVAALAVAKLLNVELSGRGVRVDVLAPGWTDTPMAEFAAQTIGRTLADIQAAHPGHRILTPREIAEVAAELLFDRPDDLPSQFVVWDLRDSPEPVRCPLSQAFDLPRDKAACCN